MADDEIVTLDSGEQVRVLPDGRQVLIPGADPVVEAAEAKRSERQDALAARRQARLDALAQTQADLDAAPTVPPEKRIF